MGCPLELPCINRGKYMNCITGNTIFIGFVHISGLESDLAHRIIQERELNGPYTGQADFIQRVQPGLSSKVSCLSAQVLAVSGQSKQQLLWQTHMMLGKTQKATVPVLFRQGVKNFELPAFEHDLVEDAYDEIELLDFPVTMSYFDMLKTKFRGEVMAKSLKSSVGKQVRMAGALVTIKYVRTIKHEIMQFVTFIDNEGEFFDVVMFPDVLKKNPTRGRGVYLILGSVVDDFGYPSVEAQRMAKLPPQPDPRYR
jgi:error-prone DNA polymerase